ncbi:MAG: TRIC cation channel family protein [Actinobacteria bacterium]|nr:TRIC cation channel family protein [Actinomycetota bacterium]
MDLLHGLDLLSTFVFALVGARVAADKGLDYGGIAFIAAIASVSGGTLRNVFLGLKPIWITDPSIIAAVILAVFITLVLRRVTHIGKTLLVMDTFGLAIATISGTQLAFEQNIDWYSAILLGVITAVTGGLLRDVLCQLEPVLLHRETIGTSSLMGAITFVVLTELSAANSISAILAGSVVVLTRVLSIRFDLHLPKFGSKSSGN